MIYNDLDAVMCWGAFLLAPPEKHIYPLGVMLGMMDSAKERLRRL